MPHIVAHMQYYYKAIYHYYSALKTTDHYVLSYIP